MRRGIVKVAVHPVSLLPVQAAVILLRRGIPLGCGGY
jgi:hypothetical protein